MNGRTCEVALAGIVALSGAGACGEDPYPYVSHPDADLSPDAIPVDAAPPPGGEGFVWLVGSREEGVGERIAIQPIYPTGMFDPGYFQIGFDMGAFDFRFRRMDGRLFYDAAFRGIVEDHRDDSFQPVNDVDVATPPCKDNPAGQFDFDGAGVAHYECPVAELSPIYRDGTMIADMVEDIAGVLDDGRVIITEKAFYVVLDPDGTEDTRHTAGLGGPSASAATVVGNDAYLLFRGNNVIVRFNGADSTFTEVGQVTLSETDLGSLLVHPAGRLFVNADDPDGDQPDDRMIVSYAFDGSDRQVHWRETEQTLVRLDGNYNLFYQPGVQPAD